jgi:glyoxylase-like metal-dependent hydrolase (beta-lactamase superfamily II)
VQVVPGVRTVLAPNPSPMTGAGTNSYLVGEHDVVVVDPGPADAGHIDRLVELSGGAVRYVVVTHGHGDHAPGARLLAERSGAVVLGPPVGADFAPDGVLADGDVVAVPGWRLGVLHTPGHSSDHLCYLLEAERATVAPAEPASSAGPANGERHERLLFSGDLVLGGTSTIVAAPDGDMADYLRSLDRLQRLAPPIDLIAPGHGRVVSEPRAVLAEYVAHRLAREAEVLEALARLGNASPSEIAAAVYPASLPAGLVEASRRQVWAHLRKLGAEGRARGTAPDEPQASWAAV